eukprot:CAMPEP_0173422704 /NCGR_PEP_ID=MMETSP1357-20121228/3310_1 /TAXON_ID=77926 /ORGANISM="Hemiselmis rufescens, Strain PCC563" /LENGTH=102 /DNA_ID=CAMNT_0014385753 /DNA_START=141 /DNA_END=446 /DNA_ORIENTATION=+
MAEQDTGGAPRELWEREQQACLQPQPPLALAPTGACLQGTPAKCAKASAAPSSALLADYRADAEGGKSMAQGHHKKGLAHNPPAKPHAAAPHPQTPLPHNPF